MNQYLLDFFRYNNQANKTLIHCILTLPDKTASLRLMSHLVSSQNKWHNRIIKAVDDHELDWFAPVFNEHEMEGEWDKSYARWELLLSDPDTEPEEYVVFTRKTDGRLMRVKIKDIIFQLNCHAVHHRAQINTLISSQGVAVPPTDYIYTAISEVE